MPKNIGKVVCKIFEVLVNDIKSYRSERQSFEINYGKLAMGDLSEARFVLGKIVLDTVNSGIIADKENI